jgi:hypothetical protein
MITSSRACFQIPILPPNKNTPVEERASTCKSEEATSKGSYGKGCVGEA